MSDQTCVTCGENDHLRLGRCCQCSYPGNRHGANIVLCDRENCAIAHHADCAGLKDKDDLVLTIGSPGEIFNKGFDVIRTHRDGTTTVTHHEWKKNAPTD